MDAAQIAYVGSAVPLRISVYRFPVKSQLRHAYAVVFAHDGRAVGDHDHEIFVVFPATQERKHAGIRIVAVQPLEAVPVEVHFMQGRFPGIERVQIRDQSLNAAVIFVFEQVPF